MIVPGIRFGKGPSFALSTPTSKQGSPTLLQGVLVVGATRRVLLFWWRLRCYGITGVAKCLVSEVSRWFNGSSEISGESGIHRMWGRVLHNRVLNSRPRGGPCGD